ncbi:MAG TPA: trypsin-like peptidase domain-containing protein, partial [Solirubrobacteraceae bacterium]|nr:trypsin-like peptidase domain-containing protein [Solirubrobacteraceae bacterium]
MGSTPPLWTGREAADDHGWLARPAARPRPVPDEPPPPPPRRRPGRRAALAALAVAVVALAVLAGTLIAGDGRPEADSPLTVQGGRPAPTRINAIYDAAARGVVSVQVAQGTRAASGTGFVVGADGTIVTNAHVIDQAESAQVRFD